MSAVRIVICEVCRSIQVLQRKICSICGYEIVPYKKKKKKKNQKKIKERNKWKH
jgi:ribosomal protein L37E